MTILNFEKGELRLLVRPGKTYFFLGVLAISASVIFGIWAVLEEEPMFELFYKILLLPAFFLSACVSLLFYFRKKLYIFDDKMLLVPFIGRKREIMFSDISAIYVKVNEGISRPIIIYENQRKMTTVVSAYSGYYLLEQVLREKCRDKLQECR